MSEKIKQLQILLTALEKEMQRIGLWQNHPIDAEKLLSQQPFCVDTMAFEQWLQWVFIAKMQTLLTSPGFSGLPNPCDIHTMAEHVFKDYTQDTAPLCHLIKQMDDALNRLITPS